MSPFEVDSGGARESYRARQQAWLDSCPEAQRPHLQRLFVARESGVKAIFHRNRLSSSLEDLTRLLGDASHEATLSTLREAIESARQRLDVAEKKCDQAKAECRMAEEDYRNHVLERRIREAPESAREAVRALLMEEREAISAAGVASSVDEAHVGRAGRRYLDIDLRVKHAEACGATEEAARLATLREQARPAAVAEAEAANARQNERIREIHGRYAERLREIIERKPEP